MSISLYIHTIIQFYFICSYIFLCLYILIINIILRLMFYLRNVTDLEFDKKCEYIHKAEVNCPNDTGIDRLNS